MSELRERASSEGLIGLWSLHKTISDWYSYSKSQKN